MQSVSGTKLDRAGDGVSSCLKDFDLLQEGKFDLEESRLMPDIGGRPFRVLSSSEKLILYLGMKMAISQVMPGAEFFVLDNPTIHLDEFRRQRMCDYLLSLIPDKQIIVFTNDRIFADLMTQAKRINL